MAQTPDRDRLQITWTNQETELVQEYVDTIVEQWTLDHPGELVDGETIIQQVATEAIVTLGRQIRQFRANETENLRRRAIDQAAEQALAVLIPQPDEPEPEPDPEPDPVDEVTER